MNVLLQRHWAIFRKNKRAFYSAVLFLGLFLLSLLSPFIANDKPLIVSYKGGYYFPLFTDYTDEFFGGSLPTMADYKDRFTVAEIEKNGFMVMPIIPFSYDTFDFELETQAPAAPSARHWLGTDDSARDLLARLLYGLRISILFGVLLTVFSSVIGLFVGAIQGYFGGKIDLFFQRFLEIWGSLPQLFILIIVSSLLLPSFWTLLIVLLLFSWTSLVGVVRAEFLRTRNFDYVKAAKVLGMSNARIIIRHILPNAMVSALTYIPFILSGAIVALTALDFLGFGLPAGEPSLGELVRQGKENLQAPWIGISTFVLLSVLLSCLIFVGEGVRDALDPYRTEPILKNKAKICSRKDENTALLSVKDLHIAFGDKEIVHGISFDIPKGKTVAFVGHSGSGKSVTALTILGLLAQASVNGSICFDGKELLSLSNEKMRRLRGRRIALVFQEPMTSLNPLHKVSHQIGEVLKLHFGKVSKERLNELLRLVELTETKRILNSYPHQLSGGERQRVMIAMALAGKPDLLIADEPTTALDVVTQKQILDLLKKIQKELSLSILFISHDKYVVSYMTDLVYRMQDGMLEFQKGKLATSLHLGRENIPHGKEVLNVRNLNVFYHKKQALKNLSFSLRQAETLGIVGESGCGKTTLAMALTRLIKSQGTITSKGSIQIVFQDPFSSLNPRMTIGKIVEEGLRYWHISKAERYKRASQILQKVGLEKMINSYPHQLSGGERQRVALARAIIVNPAVLVLDEPTSALDEKRRQEMISLLKRIQKDTRISYIFISHDMGSVRQMADRIIVLKKGEAIENGRTEDLFSAPKMAYTQTLIKDSYLME